MSSVNISKASPWGNTKVSVSEKAFTLGIQTGMKVSEEPRIDGESVLYELTPSENASEHWQFRCYNLPKENPPKSIGIKLTTDPEKVEIIPL